VAISFAASRISSAGVADTKELACDPINEVLVMDNEDTEEFPQSFIRPYFFLRNNLAHLTWTSFTVGLNFPEQPGAGVGPVMPGRARRDAETGCNGMAARRIKIQSTIDYTVRL
jgi:hypothetical protein